MSNIYIQEPPTSGKVLLKTSVGDIDVELWAKECPKACRNFIQLCMEGYYNGTIFHRVVKGFIVQGGDPCGDGTGGESIYENGTPFKDEFHSRLRFSRRGLLGMANSGKNDNASQFFFTLGPTEELQNQNTLFGKVTGDTVFNMLKLEEGMVDHNERPMYPHKILGAVILTNPFEDIVPRQLPKKEKKEKNLKKREKGVKNFGLLSFGEEAEEDEEETNHFVKQNVGKAKSMHDVVDDPKLSKQAIKVEKRTSDSEDSNNADDVIIKEEPEDVEERRQRIKDKLSAKAQRKRKADPVEIKQEASDSEEDYLMTQEQEKKMQSEKKKEEIRKEIKDLKKQYVTEKKIKDELLEQKQPKKPSKDLSATADDNEIIQNFISEKQKYAKLNAQLPKKGASREDFTLSLLSKFRAKLEALKEKHDDDADENKTSQTDHDSKVEAEIQGDDWLAHTLRFEDKAPVLAKDASTKNDDWYDAYDPRNPLNKRKRGETGRSDKSSSNKGKH